MQISGIQKYYDVSQLGPYGPNNQSVVGAGGFGAKGFGAGVNGRKGSIYGIPVYVTANIVSNLQSYRNLLLHKSCFGFATQTPGGGQTRVVSTYENRNLAWLTNIDIIYGVKILREPAGVVVNGNVSATTA